MPVQTNTCVFIICLLIFVVGPAFSGQMRETKRDEIFEKTVEELFGEEAGKLYEVTTAVDTETGTVLLYLPSGDLYPPYVADPVRVGFGIQAVHVSKIGIENSSDSRVNLRTGAVVGIVRSQPLNRLDIGWQVSLVGGLNDQNDVRENLDNIGWDGRYGLLATMAMERGWAFKTGLLHVSSHVGDEFIERTGRKRISYTRQEVVAGVSRFVTKHWRLYGETGRAFSMSNQELQKKWRTQFGIEYESEPKMWKGRMAWYAAMDSQSFEERNWRVDVAIQTGVVVRSGGKTWRAGVDWYNGRPPIGEFFQDTERYVSMGIWFDI